MKRLISCLVVFLAVILSSLVTGRSASGAGESAGSCFLVEEGASLVGEPASSFRKVSEYGRSTIEVIGPGRLVLGDSTWSSYSVDLQVELRRGGLVVELLRGQKGHYALRLDQKGLMLERALGGSVELLERAERATKANQWASLHIDLSPHGSEDRILVSLDGQVIMGNPDDTFTSGGLAVVVPSASNAMLRGFKVEGACATTEEAPSRGCATPKGGVPPVLQGPVLEAESSVGQWHRGEVTYDTSDYFNPPVPLKFRGAFTDETCPRASSDMQIRIPKVGVYHLLARIFSPGGQGWNDLVRATISGNTGQVIQPMDGAPGAHIFGHGSGLVSLGAWKLSSGLYTLSLKAATRHSLVIDYLVLLPQVRVGDVTWALLPQSGGMHRDGWRNGMAALTVESSALTSTSKSTMSVALRIPAQGRYSLILDAWYTGPRAPLKVTLTSAGEVKALTIKPNWASGEWAVQVLGPLELSAGEARLTLTHNGSGEATTWATDSILLIPE